MSEFQKIGIQWYAFNASKGIQEKPIFEDSSGLWIGKTVNRVGEANEKLAGLLYNVFGFNSFRYPRLKTLTIKRQKILLVEYIPNAHPYKKKGSPFQFLTYPQMEVGLLARIMANVDGNYANLIMDANGNVWSFDYELSGKFDYYDLPLLEKKYDRIRKQVGFFMDYKCPKLADFSSAIKRINKLVISGELDCEILKELCVKANLPIDLHNTYVEGIWNCIVCLEAKMQIIIEAWYDFLSNKSKQTAKLKDKSFSHLKRNIPFYLSNENKSAITTLKMALEHRIPRSTIQIKILERMINYKPGKNIHLIDLAKILQYLKISYKYFADKSILKELLIVDINKYVKKIDNKTYNYEIPITEENALKNTIAFMLKHGNIVEIKPYFEKLKDEFSKGNYVICSINLNGKIQYIVITGFSKKHLTFHDNSLAFGKANRKMRISRFLKLWKTVSFDYNLLVINKS